MKLLCITDPATHPEGDTTVDLYMKASAHPEISLYQIHPDDVSGADSLRVVEIETLENYQQFLAIGQGEYQQFPAEHFDLVFCRADKPYAPDYLERLELVSERVPFVNSPSGLKKHISGEIFEQAASRFIADHIVSRSVEDARSFLAEHSVIVAKRSNSYGGKGVFKIWKEGGSVFSDNILEGKRNFESEEHVFTTLFESDAAPYQFVRFLKNIGKGDKRVLVVEGEVYGGYVRRSTTEHWVHNFTSGGAIHPDQIHEREQEVVAQTYSFYKNVGIRTLGYDFLVDDDGSWILSEINAGNIGGYGRLETLYSFPAWEKLLNWLISLPKQL